MDKRIQLLEGNKRAWAGDTDVFPVADKLDSSLKGNTVFIRRLRMQLKADQEPAILDELRTLSLEKYLGEAINALLEGLLKLKTRGDFSVAVQVASIMHQRFFHQFTPQFLQVFFQGLESTLTEDRAKRAELAPIRKILCRLTVELWLVGLITPEYFNKNIPSWIEGTPQAIAQAGPPPLVIFRHILGTDLKDFDYADLVLSLAKYYPFLVGGADEEGQAEALGVTESVPKMAKLVKSYCLHMQKRVKMMAILLGRQRRKFEKHYIQVGRMTTGREDSLSELENQLSEMVSTCTQLSEALGIEMQSLTDCYKEEDTITLDGSFDGQPLWDSEEDMLFYTEVPDLADQVSEKVLSGGVDVADAELNDMVEKNKEARQKELLQQAVEKEREKIRVNAQKARESRQAAKAPQDKKKTTGGDGESDDSDYVTEEEEEEPIKDMSPKGIQMTEFLERLSQARSKTEIDAMTIEFCHLNNKASLNRLLRHFREFSLHKAFMLPFYARMVATLGPYFPKLRASVIERLFARLRSYTRGNSRRSMERRLASFQFLSELTKFGLVPKHYIFHLLNFMGSRLNYMNLESLSKIFHCCGQFLWRNASTHQDMEELMESMMRRRTKGYLSISEILMVEELLSLVKLRGGAGETASKRHVVSSTPIQVFLDRLYYIELSTEVAGQVAELTLKLDWSDEEITCPTLFRIFTETWRVSHGNMAAVASVLAKIAPSHPIFAQKVIETVLENIQQCLELNQYSLNQIRLSQVEFVSELYNQGLLNHTCILDMLFMIICYDHRRGRPTAGVYCPKDPPDSFFRIRLVLNALVTCQQKLMADVPSSELEFFIAFFQYYIFTKTRLPMELKIDFRTLFVDLQLEQQLYTTLDGAARGLESALKGKFGERFEEEQKEQQLKVAAAAESKAAAAAAAVETVPTPEFVSRKTAGDIQAEQDFDREFSEMMKEAGGQAPGSFDRPVPSAKVLTQHISGASLNGAKLFSLKKEDSKGPTVAGNKMGFTLLSKRGSKMQGRLVALPANSKMAKSLEERQRLEREQRQKLNSYVMAHADMEEE
ncbi:Regulator of nonsense transcripts UPF2 [Yarrowia sp. C11]|nr:Regulator of nonsense transcripts UPF2 [Yarrowia sp. C11]KAG5370792.1 Regulator of nonsense transcripts UPF2 [Yarrowia sp. E02]